jgi:hypothetical protein
MGRIRDIIRRHTKKKKEVKAVYDEDVEEYLANLGVINNIKEGDRRCDCCGDKINIKNLGGIKKMNGELNLFCEKIPCIKECERH